MNNQIEDNKDVKIYSIQANSLYCVQNGIKFIKRDEKQGYKYSNNEPQIIIGESVIPNSLFLDYMKSKGMVIKDGFSYDFIVMKFDDGFGGKVYELVEEDDVESTETDSNDKKKYKRRKSIGSDELRSYFYEQGAEKPGVKIQWYKYDKDGELKPHKDPIYYQMLGRTAGKAKSGDCLFVRKDLHSKAYNYMTMGLWKKWKIKIPWEEMEIPIVSFGAYSALTIASAIDYIEVPLKNILVIRDEEVYINKQGIIVKIDEVKKCCVAERSENAEIASNPFDGEGILDESVWPAGINEFAYCRNHFFKSCLFKGNIQSFFKDYCQEHGKDYETETVKDVFGNDYYLKDIKMIVTESSIKWLKSGIRELLGKTAVAQYKYYQKYMEKHGNRFAIVKTGHASKWGEFQIASYQIMNSIPLFKGVNTETEVNEEKLDFETLKALKAVAEPTVSKVNAMKEDNKVYIEYLENSNEYYKINDVLIALDKWNSDFKYTDFAKNNKKRIINNLIKRAELGKMFLPAENLTLCGNPYALLLKAVGKKITEDPCFEGKQDVIECYTTRFEFGENLAGFRSPHNAMHNILYFENKDSDYLKKYFPELGKHTIIVNAYKTDLQARASGADFDSDFVFVTNQKEIVFAAEDAYKKYPTIINAIPDNGSRKYKNTTDSYVEIDNTIKDAQISIGTSSDLAQIALSQYFHGNCESEELENVICILAVLAQCSIDQAKKCFCVNIKREISKQKKIIEKDGKIHYPLFFKEYQESKNKKSFDRKNDKIEFFEMMCPMDQLAKIIEDGKTDLRKDKSKQSKTVWMEEIYDYSVLHKVKISSQFTAVKNIVTEFSNKTSNLDIQSEDYSEKASRLYKEYKKKLSRKSISQDTMCKVVQYAFNQSDGSRNKILKMMFDINQEYFLKMFKQENEEIDKKDKIQS